MGIANAGQPLGAALAGPVIGYLSVTAGRRASFIVIAAVGLIWVVAWRFVATDRPDEHRWLRNDIQRGTFKELQATTQCSAKLPLAVYLRRPAILATAFAFFGYAYLLYLFLFWFPTYLTMAQHLSVQKMGGFLGDTVAGRFSGAGVQRIRSDALYRRSNNALFARKFILINSLLIAAVCVALAGFANSVVLVVMLMAISVFFIYLPASTYWAILLDTVQPARVGGVGGFVHLIANLAGMWRRL